MKKSPMHKYETRTKTKQFVGMMAAESVMRRQGWIRTGCNAFEGNHIVSNPMAFWTEQDVLQYIYEANLRIADVYGEVICTDKNGQVVMPGLRDEKCKYKCTGCSRTGCVFCAFGSHLEKKNEMSRFQRLAQTHPKLYDYAMRGGKWIDNPDYDPFYAGKPDETGWVRWNPKQIWVPSGGLGMRKVFDMVNELYGKDFYRYE